MSLVTQFSFEDERFLSAAAKRLILNAWLTFLRHGCRQEHFSERLYDHLSLHCSFIAHFDRNGFYDFYFAAPGERTHRFLDQFGPEKHGITAEYGDAHWLNNGATGSDLNYAMRKVSGPYISKLRFQFSEAERQSNLRLASLLAAKHGRHLSDGRAAPQMDASLCVSAGASQIEGTSAEQLSMFAPADQPHD